MPAHQYSVTQAVEVIQKLKQLKLNEKSYMTVFDFKATYPSVKLEPCFGHLRDFLLEKVENAAKVRRQVLELAHLATFSSFFEFEDTTYKQHRGVPMGSPVSGLLCELVVRSLESSKLHKYKGKIVLYARYVDDVCIIWNEKPDVEKFSRDMNNNIFGLELEIEQQSHRKIHFLDIDVEVEEEGKITTKVYRKPSYIPEMIPWASHDPTNYKLAAFRALLRRAYTHCSRMQDTRREVEYIKKIAENVGVKSSKIKRLVQEIEKGNNESKEKGEFTIMEYRAQLSNIYRRIGIEKNKKVAYRRNPTIFQLLRNDKAPIDRMKIPGVYRIPVQDKRRSTELYYIGATKRSLAVRLEEHKRNVRCRQPVTALANYAIADPDEVSINWDNAKIVQKVANIRQLKYTEAWCINKYNEKEQSINFKESYRIPSAWRAAGMQL
ncbi:uncharacterized protein [Centruroides vittatus]|uniref:uncharacterized protein n=1 Tax=Centruroides vittatus TaxID=120091 RepID=UPI00350FDE3C